jgi:hypothetical protein
VSLPAIRSEGIPVLWREHPFSGDVRHILIHPQERMPSIAEIVASIPDLPEDIRIDGGARINGIVIPREMWGLVRPKYEPGRVGVTLHYSIHKGGSVGSIVGIAALLAAAAITGGAAAPLLGSLFTSGTIASTALAAGVGILGSLAASALAPPPVEEKADTPETNSIAANTAAVGGNFVSRGQPLKRIIGTTVEAPQRITDVLIERSGNDVFAECVFAFAGPHEWQEIYFDGQKWDAADLNVEVETKEGWVADTDLTLVTRQSRTDTVPIQLSVHKYTNDLPLGSVVGSRLTDYEVITSPAEGGGRGDAPGGIGDNTRTIDVTETLPEWHRFSTRANPDEFWIDLNFSGGLKDFSLLNEAGGTAFRLRVRRRGDATWINLPEIHYATTKAEPFHTTIKLHWETIPDPTPVRPVSQSGPGWYIAFHTVPGQNGTTVVPATSGWTADTFFTGGAVVDATRDRALSYNNYTTSNVRNVQIMPDAAEIYLLGTGTPFAHSGSGVWEIEIKQSSFYTATVFQLAVGTDASSPGNYIFGGRGTSSALTAAVYDFFEYRTSAANDYRLVVRLGQVQYQATIDRRANVWNEYPIVESGANEDRMALLAIRVKNRNVSQVTAKVAGIIHIWNGTDWLDYGTSSNPAENFREVLNGDLGKLPQSDASINDTNILAWRQHCIDNDYTIDATVQGKSYRDVLKLIAAAGWARERDAEQWGVIWDYDRAAETPGQIFTAREVSEFSIRKAFAKIPDGFRATFKNEDDEYIDDEVVVLDPYNAGATEYGVEEVAYAAFTDSAKVTARALFDIRQAHKRQAVFQFKVDTLALMAERNDLIGVNYDTISRRYGSARIRSITTSSGNVTGLVLDGTVPEMPGGGFARIRKKDGAGYITAAINSFSSHTTTLTFSSPFSDPGTSVLAVDAVVWVCDIAQTERRLIVTNVSPSNDFTSTITCVDEAPEIWT